MGNSGNVGLFYLLCCCPLYASLWASLFNRPTERIVYVERGTYAPVQRVHASPATPPTPQTMGRGDVRGVRHTPALTHLGSR